ncbi:class I SAM-dependent rRNA methyltransferase [Geothermobacter hydrogeniphilus]|uniref:SAM-dependent methyltransferase n=1 Tax=Geothermobacter hydrogeniphilus TaxID=1969733 RepID=A0A1X0YCR8_9BACT|nr:class I SAM-dependent rRNA methyltransferase [Geothermobacter hydrogeniphilus]ORJ63011.1 SAM-dependent methyltransferase [Geothermobacter hydrogeniphilus]
MALRTLKVGAETARMLQLGHPWVIADRYTAAWPASLHPGQLARLQAPDGGLLGTALLEPGARVVARLLDRDLVDPGAGWFSRRLQAAEQLRERFLDLDRTDAFRLVNGEGDGLPGLTVDRYRDWLVVQFYTPAWQPYLKPLLAALEKTWRPAGIYLKQRPQQTRNLKQQFGSEEQLVELVAGKPAPEKLTVREHGLRYLVRLNAGLHTGLFLDQRDNRRRFGRWCRDRKVLNLFCFTGAFSVAAVAAGAAGVTSVDASRHYLDWVRDNAELNGQSPQQHELLCGDCRKVLKRLARENRLFDLVFVDPPSFSTTRKGKFSSRGGTAEIIAALLAVLKPGGLVMACSNHQKMEIADYLKELRRGGLDAGRNLKVIDQRGQGGDFPYPVGFPEGRYLKVVTLVAD